MSAYVKTYALRRVREIALIAEAAPLCMGEIIMVVDKALGESTELPEWMTATRADSALMNDIRELLSDLSTYFNNKADLQDGDYGTQEPNAELRHHAAIEALLKRIGG